MLAVATLVGGAIVYLSTPIVTRVFDPAALGGYGIYLAAVSLLVPLATQGYQQAVPIPVDDDEAWSLVRSVLVNAFRFSFLVLATVALGTVAAAIGPWNLDVSGVLWIVPFGVFFAAGQAVMLLWLVRLERYPPTVRARIGQGVTMAGGQPALGLASGLRSGSVGSVPLAVGDAFSTAVGLGALAAGSGKRADLRTILAMRRDKPLLRRYRHFMLAGLPAAELNALTLQIPFLVIVAAYGSSAAGQYALIERLFLTPVGIITGSVSLVLARQAALRIDDPEAVRSMFRSVTAFLAIVGSPLVLLAFLDTRSIVGRLLGDEWTQAASMLRPLALLFFVNLVTTPWGATLAPTQRQDLFLVREIVRMVLIGGAAVWILIADPPLLTGVTALAWISIASYLWYLAVCSWALRHPRSDEESERSSAPEGGEP